MRSASFRCVGPKVLLEDVTRVIDNKSHHAGITVFGRIGDKREAADHLAAENIVQLATGSAGPCLVKDIEIVAMERRSPVSRAIALRGCLCDELAQGDWHLHLGRPANTVRPSFLVR